MWALLLNGYEFLGNRIVGIRCNANTGNETLQEGAFYPGLQHPTLRQRNKNRDR
jgi:hypothetical protein